MMQKKDIIIILNPKSIHKIHFYKNGITIAVNITIRESI